MRLYKSEFRYEGVMIVTSSCVKVVDNSRTMDPGQLCVSVVVHMYVGEVFSSGTILFM